MTAISITFLPHLSIARPLLTEPVETVGKYHFEAGFSLSERRDKFNSPEQSLETVVFPAFATFGITSALDAGLSLRHIGQRLDTVNQRFTGSQTGQLGLELKYALSPFIGFQAIWELSASAEEDQDLPIVRGNNYEANLLLHAPAAWPLHLNIGYVWRGDYDTNFGVQAGQTKQVDPGGLFQARAALEIPLQWNLSALGEAVYTEIGEDTINGVPITTSDGEALDLLAGLNWNYKGWNIGAGAAFGVLDESHTSFDYDRGAGDWTAMFRLAYKLKPHRPEGYR